MASNKTGMTEPRRPSGGELGGALIKMLAAGVAGGAVLLAGAKMLGEKILEIQVENYKKLEQKREADREEVRRITEGTEDYEQ